MPVKFDSNGNPYPYDIVSISLKRFVQLFSVIPNKARRGWLSDNLTNYISDFTNKISPSEWFQLVGGSYTTTKELPNDIDLVNFIDSSSIENAYAKVLSFITTSNKANSKATYSIDGYLVPLFKENDPRHKITLDKLKYWKEWLGHDRKANQKAVLKVTHK